MRHCLNLADHSSRLFPYVPEINAEGDRKTEFDPGHRLYPVIQLLAYSLYAVIIILTYRMQAVIL